MLQKIWKFVFPIAIPVAIVLQYTHADPVLLFIVSALAVLPIAGWIGHSTEHLASRMGPTWGALFNATFGNLAEMIIAILGIRAGLLEVVKASLTGSILGNLLFVGGASMFLGGWRHKIQKFNPLAAESQAGQMVLAVAALLVPTVFFGVAHGNEHPTLMHGVSIGTAVVLVLVYVAGLIFTFRTHQHLLSVDFDEEEDAAHTSWPVGKAVGALLGASLLMGVVAEGLVHAVDAVGKQWGLNEVFLGFIVIAIVGNAAEHSTAITLAMKNKLETSLNIVLQSSVQIALFVTPVLVFLSYSLGHPMDLFFSTFEVLAVALAVGAFAYLVQNGESNWFEGIQLLALYAIIAVAIYYLPGSSAPAPAPAPAH